MGNTEISILLLFSSFIFLTNVLTTFYKKYYIYCFLFFGLTITSIIFHYHTNIYTNLLDKLFILSVVFYGGYLLYNKSKTDNQNQIYISLIVITFLLCIFLFFYGYYSNTYCYHPDKYIGNKYHCMLHLISSIGHHFITFL
uniref:Uncharacterized protein n=1 Tax=viral metagenome TaxID=1070528 RepID=A0A6C0BA44_9ZZZZ